MTRAHSQDESIAELLRRIQAAQEQRAQLYAKLQKEFRSMCETGQESPYMQALLDLTTKFGSVSSTVRRVEQDLAQASRPALAGHIRSIQEHERLKLHATLQLHVLRKAEAFQSFAWQHDESSSICSTSAQPGCATCALSKLALSTQLGAQGNASGRQSERHKLDSALDPNMCKHEWQDACSTATRDIEEAVEGINDVLLELRYETAQLEGLEL